MSSPQATSARIERYKQEYIAEVLGMDVNFGLTNELIRLDNLERFGETNANKVEAGAQTATYIKTLLSNMLQNGGTYGVFNSQDEQDFVERIYSAGTYTENRSDLYDGRWTEAGETMLHSGNNLYLFFKIALENRGVENVIPSDFFGGWDAIFHLANYENGVTNGFDTLTTSDFLNIDENRIVSFYSDAVNSYGAFRYIYASGEPVVGWVSFNLMINYYANHFDAFLQNRDNLEAWLASEFNSVTSAINNAFGGRYMLPVIRDEDIGINPFGKDSFRPISSSFVFLPDGGSGV